MSLIAKLTDMLYVKGPSALDKLLEEATNDQVWQVPTSQLQEIADHTYNEYGFKVVMETVWRKLNQFGQAVRSIEKALILLDYLVKNGASRCYTEAKLEISTIRRLEDFSWSENGVEKGKQIRERSEALVKLLVDENRLEDERENSRKMKEKMKSNKLLMRKPLNRSINKIASAYSNEYLPAHLTNSYGGHGSENSKSNTGILPGLGAIEDFWEEGKKMVMKQFKATEYVLDDKEQDDRDYADGTYDLETLPEVAKDQKEKGWPRNEAKRNTYGGYEGSKYGQNVRSQEWDKYAKEIFETNSEGFGGFTKSKSEVLAENAKDVKKKWEKIEPNFLEFDTKPESKPSYADFAEFEAYAKANEQKNTRPTIFDEKDSKQQKGPAFEDFWDDSKTGIRKEKSLPSNYPDKLNGFFAENPKKSVSTNADFGTLFQSNTNPQSKPTPDWLNSNPFDEKGGKSSNLMDF